MSDDTDGPGSSHFIAPPMEDLLARAKQAALNHFVTHLEKDNIPATQRAVYVLKVMDAQAVLAGSRVNALEVEAAARGVTVQALATNIVTMAESTRAIESQRMVVNTELSQAYESNPTDPTAVLEVLNKHGIELT
jgi:hypothetical protein